LALRRGRSGLANLFGLVELIQQFLETVMNALAYHLVVNALKDAADSSLILATPPGLSNLRVGMHLLTSGCFCCVAAEWSFPCFGRQNGQKPANSIT